MEEPVKLFNRKETDSPIPYMEQNGERIYFGTSNEIFLNSQCIFVEYTDIIKSPYMVFLYMMAMDKSVGENIFDTEIFSGYDSESLGEWYSHRKYQNPLFEICKIKATSTQLEEFMNQEILISPDLIKLSPQLNFADILQKLDIGKQNLVKKLVVWYPYDNDVIKSDLYEMLGDVAHFVTGPLESVLKDIPDDSTYVFSNILRVGSLLDMGKLQYSSILIPKDYAYNFTQYGEPKINYANYLKESTFKLNFFNAATITEMDE